MEVRATQCTRIKKNGQRCGRLAYRGGTVCYSHGGAAPQVKRKAAQRVALAEAIIEGDHRPPWQVLLDAHHTADVLWQRAVRALGEGGSVTGEQLRELGESLDRVMRMAKTVFDARAQEYQIAQIELEGQVISGAMVKVVQRMVEHFALGADADFIGRQFVAEELRRLDEIVRQHNSGERQLPLEIEGTASWS